MAAENNPLAQGASNTPSSSPMPRYSVNQYVKHAASIKQINEWLLDDYRDQLTRSQQLLTEREKVLEATAKELGGRETELQLARQELEQLKDASIVQFVLGILSLLLSGYGINLVTSTPPLEVGWVMIGAAIVVQGISFTMTYQAKKRKHK